MLSGTLVVRYFVKLFSAVIANPVPIVIFDEITAVAATSFLWCVEHVIYFGLHVGAPFVCVCVCMCVVCLCVAAHANRHICPGLPCQ